ncbi:MAG: GAF domain-containing protein [Chloroflexi bacterium]|nr:GAF domain-containing protein [Chloroflexota bacterium]
MNQLLRYLFIVQYDYRDSSQAIRARIVGALSGFLALLALVYGSVVLVLLITSLDLALEFSASSVLMAPALLAWTLTSLWLIQRGRLGVASALISVLLWAIALASMLSNGIAAQTVLTVPLALTYTGVIYGTRGAVSSILASWGGLCAIAYLQAEDLLTAEAIALEDGMYDALISSLLVTLLALTVWVFTSNLERALTRASRIAAQSRATVETSQVLSRILNMDELITQAVDLIRDRFAFYYVQLFLVDSTHAYANLAAGTGEIGQALLAQGYRVAITPRTIVGEALDTGEVRYIPEIDNTAFRRLEMLPDTRTELALPIMVGEEVAGALDIHSLLPDAFRSEDIEAMQVMANQIGQAIRNARLFESQQEGLLQNRRLFLESETNLREIERLNRQLTGESWREYILERSLSQMGVQMKGHEMHTTAVGWTAAMEQAMSRQRIVIQESNEQQVVAVPINVRGQVIGAIEVTHGADKSPSEVRNIVQAVAERMAFSLENARLFEQARMSAEREQQINTITAQLQGLNSITDVLTTALNTLGQALDAEEGQVRLVPLSTDTNPDAAPAPAGTTGNNGQPPQPRRSGIRDTDTYNIPRDIQEDDPGTADRAGSTPDSQDKAP